MKNRPKSAAAKKRHRKSSHKSPSYARRLAKREANRKEGN